MHLQLGLGVTASSILVIPIVGRQINSGTSTVSMAPRLPMTQRALAETEKLRS